MKKTYESVPYGGLLQPYGPKPVKVKPEKEEKKEKKESSDKKDKKFYPKKDRKPINVWNKNVNLGIGNLLIY